MIIDWITGNSVEVFGAAAGIIYVILEIRQSLWLWPIGIATSAAYIWIFFTARLYADMSLQVYYVLISIIGWYWWITGRQNNKDGSSEKKKMPVSRLKVKPGIVLFITLAGIYSIIYLVLYRFTDSPVPGWDAFITSVSVIATWMLARKIYEHWWLWIAVNSVSVTLCIMRGLYPTAVLYSIYGIMSVVGLAEWRKSIKRD